MESHMKQKQRAANAGVPQNLNQPLSIDKIRQLKLELSQNTNQVVAPVQGVGMHDPSTIIGSTNSTKLNHFKLALNNPANELYDNN